MAVHWSPGDGHFYHRDLHGDGVPADAVEISERRHQLLLQGRGAGRAIVAGRNGRPELAPARKVTQADLLAAAVARIKAEAKRRILAIASIERQSNDNAAIALRGSGETDDATCVAALARRRAIDAVRADSNALETRIARWSAGALATFDATDDAWWPEAR